MNEAPQTQIEPSLRSIGREHGAPFASDVERKADLGRPAIWFEVEDFLRHFDHFPNPTGIPRVSFEIISESRKQFGARVRFCRLNLIASRLQAVDFDTILRTVTNPPGVAAPWHVASSPPQIESPPAKILRFLAKVPGYLHGLAVMSLRDTIARLWRGGGCDSQLMPGDTLVSLGAVWINRSYCDRIATLKRMRGVKFVQLIHDVIPVTHSRWTPFMTTAFSKWLPQVLATADLVLTQSSYSRAELLKVAKQLNLALPPIEVVKFGTGFRLDGKNDASAETAARLPSRFVAYVSTIEIRKNHPFLLRVWSRIIERRGAEAVPALVLVGRPAHPIFDFAPLRAEISRSSCLSGKVVILSNLSDAALREVYRRCLFTVYPSLYEGWGLPVAEGMALGKVCAASSATSLPEVGGDFIDYFDPSDEADAIEKIERLLFEPGYLAAREAYLKAHYRPRAWADFAVELAGHIEQIATSGGRPSPVVLHPPRAALAVQGGEISDVA
jgi:glycosyltransferase involved in cell wall biosynthesis